MFDTTSCITLSHVLVVAGVSFLTGLAVPFIIIIKAIINGKYQ